MFEKISDRLRFVGFFVEVTLEAAFFRFLLPAVFVPAGADNAFPSGRFFTDPNRGRATRSGGTGRAFCAGRPRCGPLTRRAAPGLLDGCATTRLSEIEFFTESLAAVLIFFFSCNDLSNFWYCCCH